MLQELVEIRAHMLKHDLYMHSKSFMVLTVVGLIGHLKSHDGLKILRYGEFGVTNAQIGYYLKVHPPSFVSFAFK